MARRTRINPKPQPATFEETMRRIKWTTFRIAGNQYLGLDEFDLEDFIDLSDLIVECQQELDAGDPRPDPDWLAEVEALADELEPLFPEVAERRKWDDFLESHPELTEPATTAAPHSAPIAPRLDLRDDGAMIDAVREAERQRKAMCPDGCTGVWASDVATVLAGGVLDWRANDLRPSRSDVIRVGQHLGRLAREGRIALVSKSYESRRYAGGLSERRPAGGREMTTGREDVPPVTMEELLGALRSPGLLLEHPVGQRLLEERRQRHLEEARAIHAAALARVRSQRRAGETRPNLTLVPPPDAA